MTDPLEFFQGTDRLFQLYAEGQYADALAIAEKLGSEFPEKDARTTYWRMCLQNMSGQPEKALQTFRAALGRGVWWAEHMLRGDPDLHSLQGQTEFEQLVLQSEEMHRQAEAAAKPTLQVYLPEGPRPCPLLIFLQPRSGYPELDLRDWSPVLKMGWALAMPQSSQLSSPLSFNWDDREKAWQEIVGHVETLLNEYPIDPRQIVVAGFSQGAARAIELIMSRKVPARGFLAVVPGPVDLVELEGWAAASFEGDAGAGRGVLISGGKDPRYEMFVQIREIFAKHGRPLLFEHFPEMAHQIPNDLESLLHKGLAFILQEQA